MKILFIFLISFGYISITNNARADYCYTVANGHAADANNGTTQMKNRTVAETNAMAGTMCVLMGFLTSDITKTILAFVVVVMGFGAYMGKLNVGIIVSFTIGVAAIFAVPTIFNMLSPYSGVGAGCNCKRHVIVGYNETGAGSGPLGYGALPPSGTPGYIWQDLGLNPDCTVMDPVPSQC